MTLLVALVLGAASAGLVACGGKTNPHLLAGSTADRLNGDLDNLRAAVDSQDCAATSEALRRLQDDVTSLPVKTSPKLRRRLEQGTANLARRAAKECQQTTSTATTTTTTTPTTTATTPTTTATTTTTTTPTTTTPTTTTPTTTTPPTVTLTTPNSGGATPTTP